MIAVDTSILIAFLQQDSAADIAVFVHERDEDDVWVPPVVITELLSGLALPTSARQMIYELPMLSIDEGYWERAAATRKKLLAHQYKAKMGDTLIAQSCMDHDIPLLTRDKDFRHFAKHCGLKLVKLK